MPKAPTSKSSRKPQTMTKKKNNSGSGSATSVETDGAVYFWKPEGPHGWMGQWHECAFRDNIDQSIVYKTAEQ
jgi:hypothetical protein